jgi:hypothetical protein
MSDGPESRLSRWSRLKSRGAEAEPAPETPELPANEDGAAPVAGRRSAPLLPPLAEPEDGDITMEEAPAGAREMVREGGFEPDPGEPPEEETELTPEQEEAVRNLPSIDSLKEGSDFTPFFAENVPDVLKRQAYKALWRSTPFFNLTDGLDDYDEDFSLAKLVGEIISDVKSAPKSGKTRAGDETAASEKGKDVDNKGPADADSDAADIAVDGNRDAVEEKAAAADGGGPEEAPGAKTDPHPPKKPRKNDVRPPDDTA